MFSDRGPAPMGEKQGLLKQWENHPAGANGEEFSAWVES